MKNPVLKVTPLKVLMNMITTLTCYSFTIIADYLSSAIKIYSGKFNLSLQI
jgi:hypothetical protein